jgi:polyisoprenoid-binding protein YceI
MTYTATSRIVRTCMLGLALVSAGVASIAAAGEKALKLDSARITINGTTNVHPYTASTTAVRLTKVVVAPGEGDAIEAALLPDGLQAFEFAIPTTSLTSPKDGVDKNMHKALKAEQNAEITFKLTRLEARAAVAGGYHATGLLRVAGVEREVAFDLTAQRKDGTLIVRGELPLLMTDFGVTPPKAMLGMLKTDPKITIQFDGVLAVQ